MMVRQLLSQLKQQSLVVVVLLPQLTQFLLKFGLLEAESRDFRSHLTNATEYFVIFVDDGNGSVEVVFVASLVVSVDNT